MSKRSPLRSTCQTTPQEKKESGSLTVKKVDGILSEFSQNDTKSCVYAFLGEDSGDSIYIYSGKLSSDYYQSKENKFDWLIERVEN